ncbi:MAG: dihydroorotate dehydrogenase electron transfer subunit [Myxococcota bacterium]|nr:dihydroorotate dehydrogenase electron transfer subunit [Myxococcota bacterium]
MSDAVTPAAPQRCVLRVRSNEPERGCIRLVLEAPDSWPAAAPGQFVMIHLSGTGVARHDPLLPRPMAAFRLTGEGSTEPDGTRCLEVLYKVVGRGTALLAECQPGDSLALVGPLGVPFPMPQPGEEAVLVGGGTGIASLFELARTLRDAGAPLRVLLGARSQDDLMALADFEALGVPLELATDDGSAGHHGLVTAPLEPWLGAGSPLRIYACGPTPMMVAVAELAEKAGHPCHLSLENRMACGFGICLGCAVRSRGDALHLVCRDGPVFDAKELDLGALP